MASTALTPQDDTEAPLRAFPNLTAKEEAFVYELLARDGAQKAAAIAAGYAKGSAHVTASRLVRKPEIIQALATAAAQQLGSLVPGAIATVRKLGLKAKSEHVRLAAAQDVLDRTGLSAPKQVRLGGGVNVTIDLT